MSREFRISDVELSHEAALAMAHDMDEFLWWKNATKEEDCRIERGCEGAADMAINFRERAERHYLRAQEIGDTILQCGMSGSNELPKAM